MLFIQTPLVQMRPDDAIVLPMQPKPPVWGWDSCLIEAMVDGLRAEPPRRQQALAMLRGHVAELAFSCAGCRLVQQAFAVADQATRSELLAELQGLVVRAARSPHANYVIQSAIVVGAPAQVAAVARELKGSAASVARHRCGCRILCRLSEHCSSADAEAVAVMDEVLTEAEQLCRHPLGHHVIQSISAARRARISSPPCSIAATSGRWPRTPCAATSSPRRSTTAPRTRRRPSARGSWPAARAAWRSSAGAAWASACCGPRCGSLTPSRRTFWAC
ncbi:unnamed protein product [Prorocentrum cordatum]|uniref:PUM-HD domain-containing protein n=1 Tax=Prorocentrum cordatum TaxID=2364126 RepID=A0ABN9SG80_9DINO|nr:unnamed protein product [Polarella glacialis]